MYAEEDLLPLSGLQHLQFCVRQWALIHIEQQWEENRLTAEGRLMHENADSEHDEWRGAVRICRGMRIRSMRLGLAGRADIVEFHPQPDGAMQARPVEYKRGKPKSGPEDRIQLCAQALCLEEMLGRTVAEGDLYYGTQRRRQTVRFDDGLRSATERLAETMHALYAARATPKAEYEAKCDNCSLLALCMPRTVTSRSARGYLNRALKELGQP
ncbi:MAG: CRISPR-associated protein Cas4 [Acidobacteriaceae bacterium]